MTLSTIVDVVPGGKFHKSGTDVRVLVFFIRADRLGNGIFDRKS